MRINESQINICMITDNNYIVPTSVTINSAIKNKKSEKYNFFIITSNLSEKAEKEFKKFEQSDVSVNIIRDNAEKRFNGLHVFSNDSICVASISALLKFVLPDLMLELDKVLYLDGDLIVEQDLGNLYSESLGDCFVAAVEDSGTLYWKNQYHKSVNHYFNSGVMLLNLKKMRDENIKNILIEAKKNISDSSLMDQNVFNLVFDGKVKALPVSYNFLPLSLDRANEKWNIDALNKKYKTDYKSKSELFSTASIIHFSSKDKPWKEPSAALAYKWRHYYLSLYGLDKEKRREKYGISAVVVCNNSEDETKQTINSLLNQNFKGFELLLIDCSKKDKAQDILNDYASKYDNISYYRLPDADREKAFNFGIQKAEGEYIHLIECGECVQQNCWEKAYTYASENGIELMMFNAEGENSEEIISEAFPKIYDGKELFALICDSAALKASAGMMIAKRELLTENSITILQAGSFADRYYIYKAVSNAKSAAVLPDILYKTKKREDTSKSEISEKKNIADLYNTILELTKDGILQSGTDEYKEAVFEYIRYLCTDLIKQYRAFEEKYGKEKCREELGDIKDAVDICMFIASSAQHNGLCKLTGEKYREINSKLQQTYKEKSEINAKLLQAYREKSEINAKLKQTYKEKSEKTKQIKRLEKYSLYPMLKKIKKALTK